MSDLVQYEIKSSTTILTLNRADKRNALSRALIAAIGAGFDRAANDKHARCIILAAAGPTFCAGMDLAELQESVEKVVAKKEAIDTASIWDDAHRLAKLYDKIYTAAKPTIAAVQGAAVAGGAGRSVGSSPTPWRTPHEWSRKPKPSSPVSSWRSPSTVMEPVAHPPWW